MQENEIDRILGALNENNSLTPDYKEDQDVLDIMKAIEQASEAGESPEVLEQKLEELKQRAKQNVEDSTTSEADEAEL